MRLIRLRNKRIQRRAKIKALIKPTTKKGKASRVRYCQFLRRDKPLAPNIIGTAMIKVKSEAAR